MSETNVEVEDEDEGEDEGESKDEDENRQSSPFALPLSQTWNPSSAFSMGWRSAALGAR